MSALALLLLLQVAVPGDTIRWEPWSRQADGRTINGQLGRLRVPVDYAAPRGGSIELAFLRLKATTSAPGAPIIYLAGGPGQSGIQSLRVESTRLLVDSLLATGDVILLDQRGTGQSVPSLGCPPVLPPPDMYRDEATFRAALQTGMVACAAHWRQQGVDPASYTTRASATDVDAVRRALGVTQIRLLGFSYGTHLGLAVIRQFGPAVERAVLAGVEGPDDNEKLPLVMDQNLERLAAEVRRDSVLRRVVPDLVATYDSALRRLEREPARIRIPHPVTAGDSVELVIGAFGFQYIVIRDLGDTHDWPLLPGLIARTAQGNYAMLAGFARRRWGPMPSLMWAAMDCASGSTRERAAEVGRQAAVSRFGRSMNFLDDATCRAIGAADLGDDYRAPISSPVPVLFVSGAMDSQTPPYQAERIRWGFSEGRHLVVENAGHESTLDVPEVLGTISRFLRGEPTANGFVAQPLPAFRRPGS